MVAINFVNRFTCADYPYWLGYAKQVSTEALLRNN